MERRFESSESFSPELYGAADALRPGESATEMPDLGPASVQAAAESAFGRLRERIERFDAIVASALHEIPVPPGLAAALLARVREESAVTPASANQRLECVPPSNSHGPAKRISRRWVWLGLTASAAAALFVGLQMFAPGEPDWTPSSLMEASIARFAVERTVARLSQPLKTAPHEDFPISSDIAFDVATAKWRWIDDPPLGRRAVAYDISAADGSRGTLYVMRGSLGGLIDRAPPTPSVGSAGACAAAWQSGGLVYVLVVEGSERNYRQFLRHTGGPIV